VSQRRISEIRNCRLRKIGQALRRVFARSGIEVSVATTRDPEKFCIRCGRDRTRDHRVTEGLIAHYEKQSASGLGPLVDLDRLDYYS
jgi:hypothetical protein